MAADARTILGLLDLTSLETSDDDARIEALCRRGVTPFGTVAAVCVYGPFVPLCRKLLVGKGVRVATVVNFPEGRANPRAAELEARTLVAAGADEIDAVLPFEALMRGDRAVARDVVAACRQACAPGAKLKVIIESGILGRPELIAEASRIAIDAGADFIKTSTGKRSVGATPEAAKAMLGVIRDCGKNVGFKAAGGVRTLDQANTYLDLAASILGPSWATPERFRIGASGLLDDLLNSGRHGRRDRFELLNAMRPRDLVKAWVEAFNRGNADEMAAFYAENATNHQVAREPVTSKAAIREMFVRDFAAAKMVCMPENIFEDGEWAILEWRDPLGLRGCGFFHVKEGKIQFQRGYWDKLSFLRAHRLPLPKE